jgi:hypothetical protein
MKRLFFLLFALAVAAGCSSSTEPGDGTSSTDSDVKSGASKLACADVGGQCIGLTPYNCIGGTWADANAVTCGPGIGSACCVMPQPPPPPPLKTQCEAKGGRCTGVTPTACPEGFFADASEFSCGPGIGSACCWACPELAPPPPGFCTNGEIKTFKDEAGCVRGFDCVQNTQNDCVAKGGQCVGLTPGNCTGGTWADATTHSCGAGIGVGCCIK